MNIETILTSDPYTQEITEHVVIANSDGSNVSMPKSVYDEMIANQNQAPTLP